MAAPDFDKLFDAATAEMFAVFNRSSSGNRPDEIGGPRERQFKNFLKDWLPEKYGISKGYLLNAEKKVSRECDVVIYSSETCPKFLFDKETDTRFFPRNEVYSTFEIKSTLNETELNDALDKISSVKTTSADRNQWSLFTREQWIERDAKIAELEDTNDWGRLTRKDYVNEKDFKEIKLKIKENEIDYSDIFCGLFAYKGGRKITLNSLRDDFVKLKNPPDVVVILDKGLLIKVDDFSIKRMKSLNKNKAHYHITKFEVLSEKMKRVGLNFDNNVDYIILENKEPKVNLMYFYTFLIDFLNEFNRYPDSYAADIISVWKQK